MTAENGTRKTRRLISLTVFFLFSLFFFLPAKGHAGFIDPDFRFSTIETDHFAIHFHQGTGEIAYRAARIAEDVHSRVAPHLRWTPAEKTQVVLLDSSDIANGMATVLPYNMMYLYLSTPFPDSTIAEYDDWLEILILHEYVHVLTMDTARGYSSVMRNIFGKPIPGMDPLSLAVFLFAAPPNVFMPYWWLEGMSTWSETEFTSSGRGRSSYYDMVFRMAVLEDRIPLVSQIDGHVPFWPDGHLPYMYGMLLEKYIARTYGKDKPGAISYQQAGRVPFFIGGAARNHTGKNYVQLYDEMVSELRTEQNARIELLKSVPVTEVRTAPIVGERVTNPRYSPDGRYLAVNRIDPHRHEEIVIMEAETLEETGTVRRLPSDHTMSWSPDGATLYFTQAELRGLGGYNFYQDIYAYDLAGERTRRITTGLRTKDIDVSPDGSGIVFIQVSAEKQVLTLFDLSTGETRQLLSAPTGTSLMGPRWSPDGRSIVYSARDNGGNSWLAVCDILSGVSRTVVQDRTSSIYPTWTPDGKYIIFTSDRTGVYNLFALSLLDGRISQVTHILGGAFHAEVSRDGNSLAFSQYHSRGFSIAEMPLDEGAWREGTSPVITPLWYEEGSAGEGGARDEPEKGEEPVVNDVPPAVTESVDVMTGGQSPGSDEGEIAIREKGSYSPVETLVPRFWLPTILSDHENVVFGALTAGQDVLGYHTLYLQPLYGLSGQGYFDAYYSYDRWYPSFYIQGHSMPQLYSELFYDPVLDDHADYWERRTAITVGIRVPLISLESRFSLIAGYTYEKDQHLSNINGRTVDGLSVFEGRRDHLFAGLTYNGALRYPYSISREEGRSFMLLYKGYARNLGSDLSQREYSADYTEYIGLWAHHVLAATLRGAASDGDLIAQQAFQIGGNATGVNEYPLRGFPSGFQTGKYVVTGSLEYRFPAYYLLRGWGTKPFFWDRLHGAVFVDAGTVWGYRNDFSTDDISVGVGAEARFDMVLGYKLPITPAVGIAQGLSKGGETQVYITIYVGL